MTKNALKMNVRKLRTLQRNFWLAWALKFRIHIHTTGNHLEDLHTSMDRLDMTKIITIAIMIEDMTEEGMIEEDMTENEKGYSFISTELTKVERSLRKKS
jgi:hypothetical protein